MIGMVTYALAVAVPITITGVGVVSTFGDSADGFRDALLDGRTGIAPSEEFAARNCRSTLAARIAGFDPARWIPPTPRRPIRLTAGSSCGWTRAELPTLGAGASRGPAGHRRSLGRLADEMAHEMVCEVHGIGAGAIH